MHGYAICVDLENASNAPVSIEQIRNLMFAVSLVYVNNKDHTKFKQKEWLESNPKKLG